MVDGGDSKSPSGNSGPKSALRGDGAGADRRLDRHGNVIQKGGTHHMSFVDEQKPGKNIVEYKEVKAYKNNQPPCGCTIA
mmetsp:Transcript_105752/g.309338  ORF Transcript_105752/g.309338 Transcript_105752/m.309338 type:complete len:80 (+) Transcript_105752:107-346(+)